MYLGATLENALPYLFCSVYFAFAQPLLCPSGPHLIHTDGPYSFDGMRNTALMETTLKTISICKATTIETIRQASSP